MQSIDFDKKELAVIDLSSCTDLFFFSVDVYSLRSIILLVILELYRAGSPRLDTRERASAPPCRRAEEGGLVLVEVGC